MKRNSVAAVILVGILTSRGELMAQAGSPQAELSQGIRQVEEGDLEAAVITLDGVIQRLSKEKGHEKDLALAHLYLGMAHLGLSQWERAKSEMRNAWRSDRKMKLDPKRFPRRVLQLYEEAKAEAAKSQSVVTSPPNRTTPPPATEKKGHGKTLPILLGVGAAAGAAVAVVAGGGSEPTPAASTCSVGQFVATNARFDVPEFDCTGRSGTQYPLNYRFDAVNNSQAAVSINSVTSRLTLFAQTDGAGCTSIDDGQLSNVTPTVLGAGNTTVTVARGGRCGTAVGLTICEWVGTITIATSCGNFTLETQNHHTLFFR
jgi:hypothetical protein